MELIRRKLSNHTTFMLKYTRDQMALYLVAMRICCVVREQRMECTNHSSSLYLSFSTNAGRILNPFFFPLKANKFPTLLKYLGCEVNLNGTNARNLKSLLLLFISMA